MKRIWISVGLTIAALALPAFAQQQVQPAQPQSLGDAARALRANKKPVSARMTFDNDNLPKAAELSVVGKQSEPPKEDAAKDAKADKAPDKDASEALAKQVEGKKKEISDLQKEIDLLQREHKLKLQNGYADASTRLRDPKKWDDDEKKFNDDVADRQKKLADAQKQLEDLEAAQHAAATAQ